MMLNHVYCNRVSKMPNSADSAYITKQYKEQSVKFIWKSHFHSINLSMSNNIAICSENDLIVRLCHNNRSNADMY